MSLEEMRPACGGRGRTIKIPALQQRRKSIPPELWGASAPQISPAEPALGAWTVGSDCQVIARPSWTMPRMVVTPSRVEESPPGNRVGW